MSALLIEKASSRSDWAAIRDVCARTGRPGGEPVDESEAEAFSALWVGPYQRLDPDWSYVARDLAGEIAGYLVAAPDSRDFHARAIELALPLPPEAPFERALWQKLFEEYPAHLHMNLLPAFRRQGVGRTLLERLDRDLAAGGSRGVHCVCGAEPKGFYEREGFVPVAEVSTRSLRTGGSVPLFALAKII